MVKDSTSDTDDDEDEGKDVARRAVLGSSSVYHSVPISSTDTGGPSIGSAIGGLPSLDAMSLSQQVTKKALYDNVKMFKESHSKTMASLTRNEDNLSTELLNVTALENSLSTAGEKFIFMQKLREFVFVICDFLQSTITEHE
ncbi:hypothetical protein ACH5RR_036101 [Cinchona calisaya]|uniref:Biogenesis of lysosome-related organelles complex 1 subunit 3 n=1 Tax=Cinchona calisaya TaxID=153742 RepID=A0ABD2Y5F5_9GENT